MTSKSFPTPQNPGETGAIEMATQICVERGVASTLVIPADIPLMQSWELAEILKQAPAEGSVLVPAADGRGTNAAYRSPAALFPLRFGNDSFKPHHAAAQATNKPCVVLQSPRHCGRCRQPRRSPASRLAPRRNPRPATGPQMEHRCSCGTGTLARPAAQRRFMKAGPSNEIRLIPIPVSGEIQPGDDILEKLLKALRRRRQSLHPGDILVVKHKIVSKAEGRLVDLATIKPSASSTAWAKKYDLDARVIELALRESRAVIRRKNGVLITETHHGFLCANSGIDVSNVNGGRHALLLPKDPDRSAREPPSRTQEAHRPRHSGHHH